MALNFPNSPTDGQVYSDTPSGNRWVWDSANTVWKSTSTFTQTITVSSTAPGSPVVGQLWWNQDFGRLLVYYNDGTSSQWVDASPSDYTSALAYAQANASYTQANAAYTAANNVNLSAPYNTANAAFGVANTLLSNVSTITFSDGSTQNTSANSFLNPIISSTYVGHSTMTGGVQWFTYGGTDFFGSEISATYRLTNDVTYGRVQGRLPLTTSSGSSNPTFWALIVSHATGVAANNNPLTVVSGWKLRLPDGTVGDTFNLDFDTALESFGSSKIPSTRYYYIAWAHTSLTGANVSGGSWYVSANSTMYPQGSGTVFYKASPGPIHPTTYNSFDGNRTAQGMEFRYYQKANAFAANGSYIIRTDKINATHSIRVDNKLAGVYELVNHTGWTSNTSAVYTSFQPGLYSHYKVVWNISHGTAWYITALRFFDYSQTNITTNYQNNGYWQGSSGTSQTINSSYFGNNTGYIWLSGNGVDFYSSGCAYVMTGDDYIYGLGVNRGGASTGPGNRFPTVRGSSQLYTNYSVSDNYMEEFSGSYYGTTATAGFCIFGTGVGAGNSRLGDIWVYGARYE